MSLSGCLWVKRSRSSSVSSGLRVPARNASRSTDCWLRCLDDVIVGGGVIDGAW